MDAMGLKNNGAVITLPPNSEHTIETFKSSKMDDEIGQIPMPLPGLIRGELLAQLRYIIELWICSVLSYVGLIDNIVAIIVFVKMGFQETVNISLAFIAFWDTAHCLTSALIRIYGPIEIVSPAFAYTWYSFTIVILGYLNSITAYVSGAVAAFVAVERCLCVSMPFKVKYLLTRKVVIVVDVLLSIGVVVSYVLAYTRNTFDWVYSPRFNQTVAVIGHSSITFDHPWTYEYIRVMSIVYPFVTFFLMCFCTVIIIYFLRKASATRSITTAIGGEKSTMHDLRDRQITVMLSVVISVYIVSYIPRLAQYLAMSLFPEFSVRGRYGNMLWLTTYIMFVFGLINASVNPIILYSMSSQFRQTFRATFRLK